MNTGVQYGNAIINLEDAKTQIIKPELMKADVLDVGWEDALKRAKAAQISQDSTEVYSSKIEARLNVQYGFQIQAIERAKKAMKSFEEISDQNQQLKDLMYELKKIGSRNHRTVQIVKRAIAKTDKSLDNLTAKIERSVMNSSGLITTKGFVTLKNQQVAFTLEDGIILIDTDKVLDLCKKIITQSRSNNVIHSRQFIDNQMIAEFAGRFGLKLEDAKQQMEEDEVGSFNKEKPKLDMVSLILRMQIPEYISKLYSKKQIERFEAQRRHESDSLALLRDKNIQIAELLRSISRQEEILAKIQSGEIQFDSKDRVVKSIQKSIRSQEKIVIRLGKQNDRTRKDISKYFDNLETYKAFMEAQQKMDLPRFDTIEEYNEALAKGTISRNERFVIGPINEEEAEYVKNFWMAEIQSAISKKNNNRIFYLPAGESNMFKERLRSIISTKEKIEAIENASRMQTKETEDRTQ